MTREEAIQKLKGLQKLLDPELAHNRADDVLCEFLRSLGYDDVVDEWDEVDRWYA